MEGVLGKCWWFHCFYNTHPTEAHHSPVVRVTQAAWPLEPQESQRQVPPQPETVSSSTPPSWINITCGTLGTPESPTRNPAPGVRSGTVLANSQNRRIFPCNTLSQGPEMPGGTREATPALCGLSVCGPSPGWRLSFAVAEGPEQT